jgi:predicted nucleotidyltransferase
MISEHLLQKIERIPETTEIMDKVREVLKPYKEEIKFAFLFGSYAKGEADIWSDVDIGIYFSKGLSDEEKNRIRFGVIDALHPMQVHIGYLDDELTSPLVFIEASKGIQIVMNDEDTFFNELLKNIHIAEEMRLFGILERD